MTTLLLLEDDQSLGATLVERLQREQYDVLWAQTLADGRKHMSSAVVDLALIDLNLPDGSGFDFARALRSTAPQLPFIFLTALNTAENRLEGYELGADEFIPKPFHLKELLIRVRKVLDKQRSPRRVQTGQVVVDFDALSITFPDGSSEHPAPRDFKLLQLLVESAPNVVSRDRVLRAIFPVSEQGQELPTQRTIDNSIMRLRQMLRKVDGEYIHSVRGVGYQWIPPSA
ncbi:MAG: response regulator transcription factor [Oligoflexia bacterium]|nr:response regulator transcription factor [Oligoflexia bacterium]